MVYQKPATQLHEAIANEVIFSWLSDSLGLHKEMSFGKVEMGEKYSWRNTFKTLVFKKQKEDSAKEKIAFVDLVY